MRHLVAIGLVGAACAAASGTDFIENFADGQTPCVSLETDPGFSLRIDRGRLVGHKDALSGNGSALAKADFTINGDFDVSVKAIRQDLGFRGVLGVIVLYDDGHFVNLYFRGDTEMAAYNSYNGHQWLWAEDAPAGALRMNKVGTTLTFELNKGSGYEVIGTERVVDTDRPAEVYLFLTGYLDERREFGGTFDDWSIEADTFNGAECFCPADFNRDGAVNTFDLLAFQNALENKDPKADFAPPWGVYDLFDFLTYQGIYTQGCR